MFQVITLAEAAVAYEVGVYNSHGEFVPSLITSDKERAEARLADLICLYGEKNAEMTCIPRQINV